jgi:hypothetical protein
MKKLVFTISMGILSLAASAQATMRVSDMVSPTNSDLFRKHLTESKYVKATGSPYISEKFNFATISGVQNQVLVRYNAESDEFEIDNGDDTKYILPKNTEYNTIALKNGTGVYNLVNYKNSKGNNIDGYLQNKFSQNNVTFFVKEKVNYIPGKEAINSYTSDTPAKLIRAKDEFYLKLKDKEVIEFPSNKKKLIALFPEKKDQITSFLKDSDPSFNDVTGLTEITKFISTL